ncbi:hypothetical protein Hamer_G013197 [Homarus americanus]|uniref:Uncharacterized protein n=1 Tax=Homarus americanus TaxID=6706 RepID=A0A8J5MVY9_HOMAM|nr:hypothetical protein Hamer_G013197 [Homarus americanus]
MFGEEEATKFYSTPSLFNSSTSIFIEVTKVIPGNSVVVYIDGHSWTQVQKAYSGMAYVAEEMSRLPDWTNTRCELQGILGAISYLLDGGRNGLVITDFRSGLKSITSPRPVCQALKRDYLDNRLHPDDTSTITSGRVITLLKKAALKIINEEHSEQRGASNLTISGEDNSDSEEEESYDPLLLAVFLSHHPSQPSNTNFMSRTTISSWWAVTQDAMVLDEELPRSNTTRDTL